MADAERATDAERRMELLEERLAALEGRLPDSSILSKLFWVRALTVFGYNVATWGVLTLIYFVFSIIAR